MAKVTVSDFIIALLDLAEAQSRAFQESAENFVNRQRKALHESRLCTSRFLEVYGWVRG